MMKNNGKNIDIRIDKVTKRFRTFRRQVVALEKVHLAIKANEFFVVLGPSGCGKSTLLNLIAGLEDPTEGAIMVADRTVASAAKNISLTPKERDVAMVFQSYALYPHMDVFQNIAFPLKLAKELTKAEIKRKVNDIALLLGIKELLTAKPRELSGGQRQRVAMARAIVRQPSVFLLDEPLSNLDAQLRVRLREELKKLQRKLGTTTVYVTHDQSEAMTLGDRIAILKDGTVQQVGAPLDVYERPQNTFVAGFIGVPPMNLLEGSIVRHEDEQLIVEIAGLTLELGDVAGDSISKGHKICLGVRPEKISLLTGDDSSIDDGSIVLESEVSFIERLGSDIVLCFYVDDNKILVKTDYRGRFEEGERLRFAFGRDDIHLFDESGKRLGDY